MLHWLIHAVCKCSVGLIEYAALCAKLVFGTSEAGPNTSGMRVDRCGGLELLRWPYDTAMGGAEAV